MRIITPTQIDDVAWDGYLEPAGAAYRADSPRARVTLGRPVWWPAEQALENEIGQKWTPPADQQQYLLLRLACTLHPPAGSRTRYTEATLTAYMRPRRGAPPVVAHDLYPRRLTASSQRKFNLGLGPDLKFAETVEFKLAELGAEIEYQQVYPAIQGYGLGESRPYWRFAHHAANPLLGCQSVYLVIAAPAGANGLRLMVELSATLETRFGPVRLGPPQDAHANLSWMIGAESD